MGRAAGIRRKLDKVMGKLNVTEREVSKRVTTRSGGDSLIGKPLTTTKVDTKLVPPPVVIPIPVGGDAVVVNGVVANVLTDRLLHVSPTALSSADLANRDMSIVMKAGSVVEEFSIASVESLALEGVVVLHNVLLRTRKR